MAGALDSEIEEVVLLPDLPQNLTYPQIQPHLLRQVLEALESIDCC